MLTTKKIKVRAFLNTIFYQNKLSIKTFFFYIILGLSSLLYFLYLSNPIDYYFLNDDFIHIPLAAERSFPYSTLYRPISDFSLWLDHFYWEKDAYGYHLTNLIIHILNSVLVFFWAKTFLSHFGQKHPLDNLKSFLSSVLFLLYANHSESVYWIIGRGGSISTLFFLTSFIGYMKKSTLAYVGSLLSFLLGLLAYEIVFIFPLILTVLHIAYKQTQKLYKLAGIWLLFSVFLIFRSVVTNSLYNEYALASFYNLNHYRLFYNFNCLLGRTFLPPMENSIFFLSLYILLLFTIAFIILVKKSRLFNVILICLLISFIPVLSLGIDTHDTESERFIYLGTVFTCFSLIEALSMLRNKFFIIFSLLLMVFHSLFLKKASSTYKFGGFIAKKSLECIPFDKVDAILAKDLPSQYKGALIFRIGFPEAIKWFSNGKNIYVNVLSQKEIHKEFEDLKCDNLNQDSHHFPTMGTNLSGSDTVFLHWKTYKLEYEFLKKQ
jgi:hypothetical protein